MENIKYIDITQLPEDLWQDAKNLIALDSNGDVIKAEKKDSYSKEEIDDLINNAKDEIDLTPYAKKEDTYTKVEVDDLISNAEVSADNLNGKIKLNQSRTDYTVTQPTVSGNSLVITDVMSDKNKLHTFGFDEEKTSRLYGLLPYGFILHKNDNSSMCENWDASNNKLTFEYVYNPTIPNYNDISVMIPLGYVKNGSEYSTEILIDCNRDIMTISANGNPFRDNRLISYFGFSLLQIYVDDNPINYNNLANENFVFTDLTGSTKTIKIILGTPSKPDIDMFKSIVQVDDVLPTYLKMGNNNIIYGYYDELVNTSEHPELLSDYIRYSNNEKAYILTDKNTTFKTINGEQITGNGNIEVSANVDLSNYATKTDLNTKQDVISDLQTIRSGAALGSTALQSVPSTYALKTDILDISTKQDKLVSGTNIKTVNGTSLLGSGDITIEGGSVDLTDYYTKQQTNALVNPKLSQVTLTQAEYDALQTKENNVLYVISDAEDIKFKTINGAQITGEGNIEVATKSELNAKQDVITDLVSIRSGAAKGATALQSVPSGYATEQWVNEQGFLKEHQDISNLATKAELETKQDVITDLQTIRSGAAKGDTALQSVPDTYALKSEIKTVNGISLIGSGNIEIAKEWIGTQAQYDALSTKDNNTTYYITE